MDARPAPLTGDTLDEEHITLVIAYRRDHGLVAIDPPAPPAEPDRPDRDADGRAEAARKAEAAAGQAHESRTAGDEAAARVHHGLAADLYERAGDHAAACVHWRLAGDRGREIAAARAGLDDAIQRRDYQAALACQSSLDATRDERVSLLRASAAEEFNNGSSTVGWWRLDASRALAESDDPGSAPVFRRP